MAGNIYGEILRITTFGESHGLAIGVVLDGVPANIPLSLDDIQKELDRRRPGQSEVTTSRQESDQVEILSGLFEGKTTGTPLAMLIRNKDQHSTDYSNVVNVFRPGHADFTYDAKYGRRDYRGGGRSSGRETAARVAAGAVAKKILQLVGIRVIAYTQAVADIYSQLTDLSVIEKNMVRSADLAAAEKMIARINAAKEEGDSLGGIIEALVQGCPAGLGDPVFDKLNARLAYGLLSIGAIKGIEFGAGFKSTTLSGSQNNDEFLVKDGAIHTLTNNAGGILGGISNGEDIVLRVAVKPPSSIAKKQNAVNKSGETVSIEIKGRHDPCLCPRVIPVVEAMIALTIADCLLIQKSQKSF
jgi:chorismate synthase